MMAREEVTNENLTQEISLRIAIEKARQKAIWHDIWKQVNAHLLSDATTATWPSRLGSEETK